MGISSNHTAFGYDHNFISSVEYMSENSILNFNVKAMPFCVSYNLLVGSDRFAHRILRICGNSDRPTGPVNSTGNVMTLEFFSDYFISDRGFLVSVSAIPRAYLNFLLHNTWKRKKIVIIHPKNKYLKWKNVS